MRKPARAPRRTVHGPFIGSAIVGAVVGIVLVIAATGVWTLWAPGAANDLCVLGQELTGATATPAPSPNYDQQVILFDAERGTAMTASANVSMDTDSNGFGAAYLVNAQSTAGYWYQVGVAYDWGWQTGYLPGFEFVYAMFSPGSGPQSPTALCLARAPFDSSQPAQLSISIQGGLVQMSLAQPGPGVLDSVLFSAQGASSFVASQAANPSGFFSGWMTEWRHAAPYQGASAVANYSIGPSQSTAYFAIGEYDVTNGEVQFADTGQASLACQCTQTFTYAGATATASPGEFTTS